ncbi:MAG: aminotransferase class IV [Deltaproteobacteria bacterium]|nr:aminotransferase class IV [Deltaproteobacteria bacterium]
MKIYLNGKIMEAEEAKISVFDRAYLFGEGLFETFRSYGSAPLVPQVPRALRAAGGKVPFLDKHLARLEWSTTFVGLPFPHPQTIQKAIFDTLAASKIPDARIKVLVSGLNPKTLAPTMPTDDMEINLVVTCEKFNPYSDEDYENGVALVVIHSVRNEPPPASNIKSISRLVKMIARKEFSEKEAFDGILLNAEGLVTETTQSNIFWVTKGTLHTPPTSLGLLAGVTRQIIIDLAKEEGIPVSEKIITPEQLKKSDEVFITGSTLEVMPVVAIDEEPIGTGSPGKIAPLLAGAYKERIREEMASSD